MKEYRFNLDVHIFDTDCYGVMWHGAYTKWLEMARVNFLKAHGIELSPPDDPEGYVYPVVEQHLKFRSPARMGDVLTLSTTAEIQGHKIIFHQEFCQLETDKPVVQAETTCMVLDSRWKPFRKIPATLAEKLEAEV